jgi:hypothetical protein
MFAIRDELFDYAASGKIAFDHPAYRLLRQSMNGMIRYGHRITFFQICMTNIIWKIVDGSDFRWTEKWSRALDSLEDDQVKRKLLEFHERAWELVSLRVILGSPALTICAVLSMILMLFHYGWKSLREAFQSAATNTVSRVVDRRLVDEEAARAAA